MDIGDLAEDVGTTWATAAGFTVNSPHRDRHGWDSILEINLPRAASADDPLGLPSLALSCRFQIKGTRSTKTSVPIQLSNWQRAIQDPLPWFVLAIRFSKHESNVLEAALIHIGKRQIERAVRRIFSLAPPAREALHKKKLSVRWDAADRLALPFPEALRRKVETAVEGDMQEYAATKRKWYANAGLADPPVVKFNFTVGSSSAEKLYQNLARAAIGLDDGIEISEFRALRERFGVDQAYSRPGVPTGTKAKLHVGDSSADHNWELVLLDVHGSRAATLAVSVRSAASIFPMLPKSFQLVRVQRLLLDLILDMAQSSCSIRVSSPKPETAMPVRDLKESVDFLMHLHTHHGEEVRVALERGGQRFLLVGIQTPLTLDSQMVDLSRTLTTLWSLICNIGIAHENVSMSLAQVGDVIAGAEAMLAARTGGATVFEVETTVQKNAVNLEADVVVITDIHVTFGERTYIEIAALIGKAELIGENDGLARIRVMGTDVKSLGRRCYRREELQDYCFAAAAAAAERDPRILGNTNVLLAPRSVVTD